MKLVLFDVDGTLVDSQNIIVAAQRMAFAACGLEPPSRERSLSIVGLSLAEAFTVLAGPKGPIAGLVEAYKDSFHSLRQDPANAEPLFPGVERCLEWLHGREDAMLGIATGKSRRGVAHLLERHGWHDVFSVIQTADDAPSKPHPGMILQAMREMGAQPQDTVMVGDSSFDMGMARAAGVLPVGVSWGFQPVAALAEAGAGPIVHSYAELEAVLTEFLNEPSKISV
ncbi:HAD-IA family hydrolase [Microvirga lotononidis]|uniref:Haloacid dehalogenase superfamily enzyme, subfamily IA n=1 Tax=Microvirga lotononidis TaxID=864069 RepID=I4YWE4_9HYPH|nr:HAD-IA family hydrolase [Microvirga lotononidis]EIM28286.1 haloacid dehalogenase superfamily enzyme, subfamily IA [Microvirga lotononidis]WQO27620.1 HAD-IA family hydrolase [Microvirga lotononidis]